MRLLSELPGSIIASSSGLLKSFLHIVRIVLDLHSHTSPPPSPGAREGGRSRNKREMRDAFACTLTLSSNNSLSRPAAEGAAGHTRSKRYSAGPAFAINRSILLIVLTSLSKRTAAPFVIEP